MKMPTSFRPGVRAEFAQGGEQVGPMPQPGQPSSDSRSEGSVYTHGQTLLDRAKERLGFSKKGLSEQAQLKLIRIRQTASNTRGAVVKSRDDIEDLRESLVVLDRNISIQEQDVSRLREADRQDPVFLTTAREEAAIIRSEIDRLQKAMAANLEISSATQALFEALSRYVAQIKPGTLTHTGVVEPNLLAGESSGKALNRLRRRLREMKSDLDYVRHAPWPSSEAKKLARSQVDALVERGRPNAFHLLDSRDDIAGPAETTHGMSRGFAD